MTVIVKLIVLPKGKLVGYVFLLLLKLSDSVLIGLAGIQFLGAKAMIHEF